MEHIKEIYCSDSIAKTMPEYCVTTLHMYLHAINDINYMNIIITLNDC